MRSAKNNDDNGGDEGEAVPVSEGKEEDEKEGDALVILFVSSTNG